MKTVSKEKKIRFGKILLTMVGVVMLSSSCSKDDDGLTLEGNAKVMIVNSASGSSAQDFYLDNNKVNSEAVAYNQSTAYISTSSGNARKAEFRNSGSASANFTGNVDLSPNENYTFFYTRTADGTGKSSVVFKDEQSYSSSTKAKVRFVNLAGGLASANLLVTGGATFASNVAYGTASAFNEVNPGTFALQTSLSGGGTTSANLGSFTLQPGKLYTIYTSGSLTSSVSAKLITHN